jgi:hypothetical protein
MRSARGLQQQQQQQQQQTTQQAEPIRLSTQPCICKPNKEVANSTGGNAQGSIQEAIAKV